MQQKQTRKLGVGIRTAGSVNNTREHAENARKGAVLAELG